jgi:hypothetical protein
MVQTWANRATGSHDGLRIHHVVRYREIAVGKSQLVPCLTSQLVNNSLTETCHDAEIRQDSRRVHGSSHTRCRHHSYQGRSIWHVRLSGHIGSDRRTVKTTRMTLSGRAHTLEDEVWRAGGDDTSQCQADRIKEIAKFSLRSALPSGDSQPEHVG